MADRQGEGSGLLISDVDVIFWWPLKRFMIMISFWCVFFEFFVFRFSFLVLACREVEVRVAPAVGWVSPFLDGQPDLVKTELRIARLRPEDAGNYSCGVNFMREKMTFSSQEGVATFEESLGEPATDLHFVYWWHATGLASWNYTAADPSAVGGTVSFEVERSFFENVFDSGRGGCERSVFIRVNGTELLMSGITRVTLK